MKLYWYKRPIAWSMVCAGVLFLFSSPAGTKTELRYSSSRAPSSLVRWGKVRVRLDDIICVGWDQLLASSHHQHSQLRSAVTRDRSTGAVAGGGKNRRDAGNTVWTKIRILHSFIHNLCLYLHSAHSKIDFIKLIYSRLRFWFREPGGSFFSIPFDEILWS